MAVQATSYWRDTLKLKAKYPALTQDIAADIVVVGGGITGIVSAYLLSQAGKKVVLLEKDYIGAGETGYTTAFITHNIDTDIATLISRFGRKRAEMIWDSATKAINKIELIIQKEKLECEFTRCPVYVFATNAAGKDYLVDEQKAAAKVGTKPELINDISALLPLKAEAALKYEQQARFHPLKFITQLAEKMRANGVEIFEQTEVKEYLEGSTVLTTSGHKINAPQVVIATHSPNNNPPEVVMRLVPYQTYVIAVSVPKGTLTEALFWDTAEPYHYLRVEPGTDKDLLILGGEDHKTGSVPKRDPYQALTQYLQQILPEVEYELEYQWSGQVIESIDGIPFIGSPLSHDNQFIATGFAGDGMVFGPLSAMINFDLIMGNQNQWAGLYKIGRLANVSALFSRGLSFTKEKLVGGMKTGSKSELDKLAPDSGIVVKEAGKKVAAYKDTKGEVHKHSAVCTHMGCTVHWNEIAKTWDCPCHGSRFAVDGKVISGPAVIPLAEIAPD